ncbi:MAG: malonic semialdehyde reductase [Rhodospirillum sp.]|nr:malonic semialdehyde reductase [Rhodospirillum sp.]MCF8487890.1 malonic semialdehyde reductase [Rhodospirillum sp.]MCF8499212.1 malonic semialdehyde reductase [Rhodospirillum sp.]
MTTDPLSVSVEPPRHGEALDKASLDQLFLSARTYPAWTDKPVEPALLERLYNILRWGPTSMNCCPARFIFVTTPEAKQRLRPSLMPGNVVKTLAAPVTVIVAHDKRFHDLFPKLWTASDPREKFESNAAFREATALKNGTLQGAYLILAARALGLDCGPMAGFDAAKVDAEFLAGTEWTANFLVNIGYGAEEGLHPRSPRLPFEDACLIV